MDQALFEKIIKKWRRRSDPTEKLTLSQIANIVFGNGNPRNARVIGATLSLFRQYFDAPRGPQAHKWGVNWTTVRRDHPHLIDQQPPQPPRPPGGPPTQTPATDPILHAMKQALSDEIVAVKKEFDDHPVNAWVQHDIGMAGDGSFLYECYVELPGDSELPVPEGVGVLLQWPPFVETNPVEATLLSYDSLNSLIIVEVPRPLSPKQMANQFRVVPRVDELLMAVRSRLSALESEPTALAWRVLRPNLRPKASAWSGSISRGNLDDSQYRSIQKCLEQDITFLWGPPGTGKTHTLARLIANAALAGKKVIATAIANVAVDQLAIRTVKALEERGEAGRQLLNGGKVLRFGHPRLTEVSRESRLFPNKLEIQKLRKRLHDAQQTLRAIPQNRTMDRALAQKEVTDLVKQLRNVTKETIEKCRIVLTTAVQTCIEPAFHETKFDMMVVDEASMMPIPYLACMGLIGRERLIVAGDFRQLGPIALAQSRAAFDWLHKDTFALTGMNQSLAHPALTSLTVQRRMHGDICALINGLFYAGMLTTKVASMKATSLPPNPSVAAVFVSLLVSDGSEAMYTDSKSRKNKKSAETTVKLALKCIGVDDIQIGIITPYRAQVSTIKTLLKDAKLSSAQLDRIKAGTVHAFQGAEADVIIWDLVDSEHLPIGRLYRSEGGDRLTNVAISRARGKLIIVGDREVFLRGNGHKFVGALKGILANRFSEKLGNLVSAKDLKL